MLQDLCLGSNLVPNYSNKLTKLQKVKSQHLPQRQSAKTSDLQEYKMVDVNEEQWNHYVLHFLKIVLFLNVSCSKCSKTEIFFFFNDHFKVMFTVQFWSAFA